MCVFFFNSPGLAPKGPRRPKRTWPRCTRARRTNARQRQPPRPSAPALRLGFGAARAALQFIQSTNQPINQSGGI